MIEFSQLSRRSYRYMDKKDILKMLQELNEKQSESVCIETKKASQGKPEKFYDTISSFANTMGGVILFGVEEKKRKNKTTFIQVGVYDANNLQKNITKRRQIDFRTKQLCTRLE